MKKPWLSEPGGLQLQALVGVWGVQTSDFERTSDLIRYAAVVFELPTRVTCAEMVDAIKAIPKKQRSALARKNLGLGGREARPAVDALTPKSAADGKSIEADLLHQVVMAVINAGQGNILKGIDDLNTYYNCRIPTVEDVVGGRPATAIIEGGITWDDKVYSFQVARLIRNTQKNSSGMFRTIGAMDSLARATEPVDAAPISLDEMPAGGDRRD